MLRLFRAILIIMLLGGFLPTAPAAADTALPPSFCVQVPQLPSSEIYLICVPPNWSYPYNVIVFAHGYVPPGAPMTQYYEQLILADGQFLPNVANGLGYAFISTSYSKNGLAVKEGLDDTFKLIQAFKSQQPQTGQVYLIGASEGGLITTLAAEREFPIVGGLALCGPIGSFQGQINYWGNFRVLFDYFYRQALPSSPVRIPPGVMVNWEHLYVPRIAGLVGNRENLVTTAQLLNASLAFNPSLAPFVKDDPLAVISTTVGILSYNIFATNEAQVELGGQPFDNMTTIYSGSLNDAALNGPRGVQRFAADPAALLEISRYYETSGDLKVPLVTMHTTGDPIVPYWHEKEYIDKTVPSGSWLKHVNIPIDRYGHCTFTTQEALGAFTTLVGMVNAMP